MSVQENVIKLRRLTGITQEELSEIAGVTRGAVSLWEIGKSNPRMGAVQSIADHFGIKKANIIEDGGMDYIVASKSGKLHEVIPDDSRLSSDEQRLLELYRSCEDKGREYLMQVAEVTAGIFRI